MGPEYAARRSAACRLEDRGDQLGSRAISFSCSWLTVSPPGGQQALEDLVVGDLEAGNELLVPVLAT